MRHSKPMAQWNIYPALFAWVVPGLGHWFLGQRSRAVILAASITLLWTAGLLIGGISVIDWREHRAWFFGQMMIAPSIAVGYATTQVKRAQMVTEDPLYEPSFARVNEQGILFTALAGLLNLLAIIDIAYRPQHRKRTDPGRFP